MADSEEDKNVQMDALVAQFGSCRNEVEQRSHAQTTIMQLTLTGVAAVLGVSFAERFDIRILLVVPPFCFVMGMLWLDHAATIRQIGEFVRTELIPNMESVSQRTVPNYQKKARELEEWGFRFWLLALPVLFMFAALPIVTIGVIVFYVTLNEESNSSAAFSLAASLINFALIITFIFFWWKYLLHPSRADAERRNQ